MDKTLKSHESFIHKDWRGKKYCFIKFQEQSMINMYFGPVSFKIIMYYHQKFISGIVDPWTGFLVKKASLTRSVATTIVITFDCFGLFF